MDFHLINLIKLINYLLDSINQFLLLFLLYEKIQIKIKKDFFYF